MNPLQESYLSWSSFLEDAIRLFLSLKSLQPTTRILTFGYQLWCFHRQLLRAVAQASVPNTHHSKAALTISTLSAPCPLSSYWSQLVTAFGGIICQFWLFGHLFLSQSSQGCFIQALPRVFLCQILSLVFHRRWFCLCILSLSPPHPSSSPAALGTLGDTWSCFLVVPSGRGWGRMRSATSI